MRQNKLLLNEDKTELLVMSPSRHAHKATINTINIIGWKVQATPSAKNLGTTFDDIMSLQPHITALVKSCNFHLRSIGQARKCLTQDATEKIFLAFIFSRLDFGNSLLYGLLDYQIKSVHRIQNTSARILTRTKRFDHTFPKVSSDFQLNNVSFSKYSA